MQDQFDKHGDKMVLNETKTIITMIDNDENTAYGETIIDPNKDKNCIYIWNIKVLSMNDYSALCIGIDSIDSSHQNTTFYGHTDSVYYAYHCFGKIYSNSNHYINGIEYGKTFDEGDTIKIKLDLNTNNIQFAVNNIDQGIAFKNIDITKQYKLAVNMDSEDDKIQLLQFQCKKKKHKKNQTTLIFKETEKIEQKQDIESMQQNMETDIFEFDSVQSNADYLNVWSSELMENESVPSPKLKDYDIDDVQLSQIKELEAIIANKNGEIERLKRKRLEDKQLIEELRKMDVIKNDILIDDEYNEKEIISQRLASLMMDLIDILDKNNREYKVEMIYVFRKCLDKINLVITKNEYKIIYYLSYWSEYLANNYPLIPGFILFYEILLFMIDIWINNQCSFIDQFVRWIAIDIIIVLLSVILLSYSGKESIKYYMNYILIVLLITLESYKPFSCIIHVEIIQYTLIGMTMLVIIGTIMMNTCGKYLKFHTNYRQNYMYDIVLTQSEISSFED